MYKGAVIQAKHIVSGAIMIYKIVEDKSYSSKDKPYKLLNLGSNNIMAEFSCSDFSDITKYIKHTLKCEIISVY